LDTSKNPSSSFVYRDSLLKGIGGRWMKGQLGFFDLADRYAQLSKSGDPVWRNRPRSIAIATSQIALCALDRAGIVGGKGS
jgi:hypothetical protein